MRHRRREVEKEEEVKRRQISRVKKESNSCQNSVCVCYLGVTA